MKVKFISKVILVLTLIVSVINFSTNGSASAEDSSNVPVKDGSCPITDIPQEDLKESEIIKSKNGNKVYEVKDPEKYVEKLGLEPPSSEAKLVGISFSYNSTPVKEVNSNSDFTTLAGTGYYLKNIRSSEGCGSDLIRSSYYNGPANAKMTISEKVSASFNATVDVSSTVVSNGVGFSVTSEFHVSDEYNVTVPSGKTYNIRAHPIYLIKSFEVWNDPWIGWDTKVGTGTAYKPIGVCFYHWEV